MVIPEFYQVWWETYRPDHMARVIKSRIYNGKYKEDFTHFIEVEAPHTKKGFLEMAVNLS
jgi:hypothetical protein